LDHARIEKAQSPPLLTVHEYMIYQEFEKLDPDKTKNINDRLVKFTILHGKLAEIITKAHEPESDKGQEISPLEKKEINEAIVALENKILKLKKVVDIKKI
jgi:hypothetical protein